LIDQVVVILMELSFSNLNSETIAKVVRKPYSMTAFS